MPRHTITVCLSEEHALALAQFVKRVGWGAIRAASVNDDECYLMIESLGQVRASLAEIGFAPR